MKYFYYGFLGFVILNFTICTFNTNAFGSPWIAIALGVGAVAFVGHLIQNKYKTKNKQNEKV